MKRHTRQIPLRLAATGVALAAAAATGAQQGNSESQRRSNSPSSQSSSQVNPYARADDTWITLGGTVENVAPNSFELNYDGGRITVEMDDDDRDADGYTLRNGDDVTVAGMIDDDLFETTTIEASSVYDPLDDEGYQRIDLGDVVSVAGNIDRDFFEGRELEARTIVTLFDHPGQGR